LVWRYRVAPGTSQVVAFNQPESVWPVHGSVLVQDGTVYAAAGRSSYLDGGIRMVGLDPVSGALRYEKMVRDEHPGAMEPPEDAAKRDRRNNQNWMDYKTDLAPDRSNAFSMTGARPDILVGADDSLYMRQKRFTAGLQPMNVRLPHLFSTSGLLDGWEHNRIYSVFGAGDFSTIPVAYPWIIKRSIKVPVGLMMAFDDETVWVVTREKNGYAMSAGAKPIPQAAADTQPDFGDKNRKGFQKRWTQKLAMRPRSLVQAGNLLILGGMDAAQQGNPYDLAAAAKGGLPGHVQLLSSIDGTLQQALKIPSPPVWDGMAVADGILVVPAVDGAVTAFGARDAGAVPE
jgi:hypothetical protein